MGLLITSRKFKEKLYPLSKCIQSVVLRGVASERGEVDHKQHLEVVSSGGNKLGEVEMVSPCWCTRGQKKKHSSSFRCPQL